MRHAHSAPATRDGQERFGHFVDESGLLLGSELEVSKTFALRSEVAKILPPTRKSGEPMCEFSSASSKLSASRRKSLTVMALFFHLDSAVRTPSTQSPLLRVRSRVNLYRGIGRFVTLPRCVEIDAQGGDRT